MTKEARVIKTTISSLIVLVIAFFVLFQSRNLIAGPQLIINNPSNGEVVEDSLTEISGIAENISEIKLNGRNIFVDERGNFNEKILLSYGYNTIIIEAKDRFNRKTTEKLELVFK